MLFKHTESFVFILCAGIGCGGDWIKVAQYSGHCWLLWTRYVPMCSICGEEVLYHLGEYQYLNDCTIEQSCHQKWNQTHYPLLLNTIFSDTFSVELIWRIVSRFLSMCCSRLIHHPIPKYPYIIIRQKGRTVHKRFSGVKIYLCPDFVV